MGVDCNIRLQNHVRHEDVAEALGILAGLPKEKDWIDNCGGKFWTVRVPDVQIATSHTPSMATFTLKGRCVDGQDNHYVTYHLEAWDRTTNGSCRLLMPRSTPFWCAIGKALVDLFGGSLDYNDCDDVDTDYSAEGCGLNWIDEDDEAFHARQAKLWSLEPITAFLPDVAAYKDCANQPVPRRELTTA